jgi:hypothetical protein
VRQKAKRQGKLEQSCAAQGALYSVQCAMDTVRSWTVQAECAVKPGKADKTHAIRQRLAAAEAECAKHQAKPPAGIGQAFVTFSKESSAAQ